MSEPNWRILTTAFSVLDAEIIKGALQAQEIPAEFFVEGAVRYGYALNFGPLSAVQICVPDTHWEEAQRWLEAYQRGEITPPPENTPND